MVADSKAEEVPHLLTVRQREEGLNFNFKGPQISGLLPPVRPHLPMSHNFPEHHRQLGTSIQACEPLGVFFYICDITAMNFRARSRLRSPTIFLLGKRGSMLFQNSVPANHSETDF